MRLMLDLHPMGPMALSTQRHLHSTAGPSRGKGNYFSFFDLPRNPELDVVALQRCYHDLQRRVHPDQQKVQEKMAAGEAVQNQRSCVGGNTPVSDVGISTYANGAYEALRSPYLRCRYLSRLLKAEVVKGGPLTVAEEEQLLVEDDQEVMRAREVCPDEKLSDTFLMEMLSVNELIFGGEETDAAVQQQWTLLRADLEDRNHGYFLDAKAAWEAKDWQRFHRVVQEWTYVDRALCNLKNRMP